jgi:hypothetical protein
MLAEAACYFVCPMMLIEKMRLPDFEYVIHSTKYGRMQLELDIPISAFQIRLRIVETPILNTNQPNMDAVQSQ